MGVRVQNGNGGSTTLTAEYIGPEDRVITIPDGALATEEYVDNTNNTQDSAIAINTAKVGMTIASTAESQAGTNNTKAITPLRMVEGIEGGNIKNVCTAWVNFNGATTPPTIRDSFNVSDVVRTNTGDFDIYTNLDNTNGTSIGGTSGDNNSVTAEIETTSVVRVRITDADSSSYFNSDNVSIQMFGGKN